jgi:hypothetical protein
MDITAKKIAILKEASGASVPLFKADGSDPENAEVIIGGFEVGPDNINSAGFISTFDQSPGVDSELHTGVYLGNDGLRIGKNFSASSDGAIEASNCKLNSGTIGG